MKKKILRMLPLVLFLSFLALALIFASISLFVSSLLQTETALLFIFLALVSICAFIMLKDKFRHLQRDLKKQSELHAYASFESSIHRLDFLLESASVRKAYRDIFYKMPYEAQKRGKKLICIDGGAHRGIVSDIVLLCQGVSYAFEPNIYLHAFLKEKYKDEKDVFLYPYALADQNFTANFKDCGVSSDAGSINDEIFRSNVDTYEVKAIDLCEFIEKEILSKNERIYFLKLDIEGAEFDIMQRLLRKNLHEHIDYIAVETHERDFKDGEAKMKALKSLIEEKKAKNIILDWI